MAPEDERERLRSYVLSELRAETRWTKLWSFAHHSFLFGAAILSGTAALTLQLKTGLQDPARTDLASLLAAIASVMGVVAAVGGFERKWRTNRLTKATLEELRLDLMKDDFDPTAVRENLKTMIRAHHAGILGSASQSGRAEP